MLESILSDVVALRWSLPLRTPQDSRDEANWNAAESGAVRDMLVNSPLVFPRIAHVYLVQGGAVADSEGGAEQCFSPSTEPSFDIGGGYALRFDSARATIALAHGDDEIPLWGEGGIAAHAAYALPDGTRIVIESVPAADHPDAVIPARISVENAAGTTTLSASRSD
ncbi:hypothetical protein [Sphingobium sp. WCS2017Hpa-17]|uniref:hypothetical protein n=1 Tax=Sphingobium sp. WCS2017Hpa-17 TaxID=3073638 RepID=UPI00288B46C9|nr:hypothetical protein [Sphingobium sp. WCS2017Hpa-17]